MTDLVLICFLILSALIGFKRGFVKTILGLTSTVMSFLLTAILYRPFSELLYTLGFGEKLKIIIDEALQKKMQQKVGFLLTDTKLESTQKKMLQTVLGKNLM